MRVHLNTRKIRLVHVMHPIVMWPFRVFDGVFLCVFPACTPALVHQAENARILLNRTLTLSKIKCQALRKNALGNESYAFRHIWPLVSVVSMAGANRSVYPMLKTAGPRGQENEN